MSTSGLGPTFGAAGDALGIASGLTQGGVTGYGSAAINAGKLSNASGATNIGGITQAGNALGLYSGLKAGGVAGDLQAANAGYGLATGSAGIPGVGQALSLYNFGKNWQSGATGSDAINGASAGASVGSLAGPVGTVAGALIGGTVGALSSAFGGGKADPETMALDSYVPQFNKNPSIASSLNPAQNVQLLAGVFDAKDNSPGHSTGLEQVFGRQGEGNFVTQMTQQVNQAISSGKISKNATPQQIYSQVVNPWLGTFKGNYGQGQTSAQIIPSLTDGKGNQFGNALQSAVTNLIGQWQSGQLSSNTAVGIAGQKLTGLQTYGQGSQLIPSVPSGPTDVPTPSNPTAHFG